MFFSTGFSRGFLYLAVCHGRLTSCDCITRIPLLSDSELGFNSKKISWQKEKWCFPFAGPLLYRGYIPLPASWRVAFHPMALALLIPATLLHALTIWSMDDSDLQLLLLSGCFRNLCCSLLNLLAPL